MCDSRIRYKLANEDVAQVPKIRSKNTHVDKFASILRAGQRYFKM